MNHPNPFICQSFPINWENSNLASLEEALKAGLSEAQNQLELITKVPSNQITYQNTFEALEQATDSLNRAWGRIQLLDSLADKPKQRKAIHQWLPKIVAFYSSIYLNQDLWNVLKVASQIKASPLQKRFIGEVCLDFEQAGANLTEKNRNHLKAINTQLAQLTQTYGEHILDATAAWELIIDDESLLDGVPESIKSIAREEAIKRNLAKKDSPCWRLSLDSTILYPTLQYASNDDLRKTLWEAASQIGEQPPFDNTELIWQILELRHRKAQLLGFPNFSDYMTERRMAKNGDNALAFIESLHSKIVTSFEKELKSLENFKAKTMGATSSKLAPWELAFWMEKHQINTCGFDAESLRPYFSFNQVLQGMFDLFGDLFGIEIKKVSPCQAWHETVESFEIYETSNQKWLGAFYTDFFPRESKRSGAWMSDLDSTIYRNPETKGVLGLIAGNMTPPQKDKPSLLTHGEVQTLFHEFGHLLHHLLSEVEISSLGGIRVPYDFVEFPSQLFENFCWHRESLDLFAKHYKTQETIPQLLFEQMISAKNHLSAITFMRQLSFAKIDLTLHQQFEHYCGQSPEELEAQVLEAYLPKLSVSNKSILRRFSHLFSSPTGYASAYYSYKWSEVLEADAFSRFEKEGILNTQTGYSLKKELLSRGNSQDVDILFQKFLGRKANPESLLKKSGLA